MEFFKKNPKEIPHGIHRGIFQEIRKEICHGIPKDIPKRIRQTYSQISALWNFKRNFPSDFQKHILRNSQGISLINFP